MSDAYALFVIREGDPQEYFDIMDQMIQRVLAAGGTYKIRRDFHEEKKVGYFRYEFNCKTLKELVE